MLDESQALSKQVDLPPPRHPETQKKLLIFDMDETLIHCVDDVEKEETDVVIEIEFPGEETVYAGINIRPYIIECLLEASKHFQVVVFTASHQVYADAILDYIDPKHELFQHRLYRQHCVLTPEGYYVKDLRIFKPE
jgi:CTD small phosphatase-like protein 2